MVSVVGVSVGCSVDVTLGPIVGCIVAIILGLSVGDCVMNDGSIVGYQVSPAMGWREGVVDIIEVRGNDSNAFVVIADGATVSSNAPSCIIDGASVGL